MLYGCPATDDLVEDVGAPCVLQRRDLRIRRLMGGGYPYVTHRLRRCPLTNPVCNTNTWTGFMDGQSASQTLLCGCSLNRSVCGQDQDTINQLNSNDEKITQESRAFRMR